MCKIKVRIPHYKGSTVHDSRPGAKGPLATPYSAPFSLNSTHIMIKKSVQDRRRVSKKKMAYYFCKYIIYKSASYVVLSKMDIVNLCLGIT